MDELGSSIRHSSEYANVCCTSFFFAPSQTMFSIFYPIVRIDQSYTEIFRNFVYDNNDTLDRRIRLLPWQHLSHRKAFLRSLTIENNAELFNKKLEDNLEIYEKCHKNDLYDKNPIQTESIKIDQDRIWKVYTDHDLVTEYLTDKHYQLVPNPDQADILFVMKQLEDFRQEILQDKLINQFPFENLVTNKELLALVARRWKIFHKNSSSSSSIDNDPYINSQGSPPWLATTFNLTYELPQFAVYYQVCFC
jgi:tubulin--tyrosine ligase-like protein 12